MSVATSSHSPRPASHAEKKTVPFFRPAVGNAEISEVVDCLRSGWLTTGPRTRQFESEFATAVGAKHAVAVNSCTAALHLAVESLGLGPGHAVLVPTMTFAATAEVVRYQGAVPVLVDCDPASLNIDLKDAARKLRDVKAGQFDSATHLEVVGIMPVHVGGAMIDMDEVARFALRHDLWVVEDAAHAIPASYFSDADQTWRRCGENTANVTCFSFYANKTMTTGEGGMAVTADADLAERMRNMSLHGLSYDAWNRFSGNGTWDYRILAPGYKYNLTDLAAAIGIQQLGRAEAMRQERQAIAEHYRKCFADVTEIAAPEFPDNRLHSWHLFPIRLHLDRLVVDRNQFFDELRQSGVGCSVHWRPLHLHPYYESTFHWTPAHLPVATREWERLISLPIFPGMVKEEIEHVVQTVIELCRKYACRGKEECASTLS
ncbi:MAG: DegT/DnrJ/EryC1/StrS family aminotransferase [Planctomycetales bacterium]|nr:DegT/DnrJ/EryC1/StrS family aminotransferase [Planctomycetales bacterium]